jgi:hypothetical protein
MPRMIPSRAHAPGSVGAAASEGVPSAEYTRSASYMSRCPGAVHATCIRVRETAGPSSRHSPSGTAGFVSPQSMTSLTGWAVAVRESLNDAVFTWVMRVGGFHRCRMGAVGDPQKLSRCEAEGQGRAAAGGSAGRLSPTAR